MKTLPSAAYLEAATERNMTILGPVPASTHAKITWQCNRCGRTYTRSLKEMKSVPGCRCQAKNAVTAEFYAVLGEALGIKWLGGALPLRTRDKTRWLGYDKVEFEAPYAELSRPVIPKRYRDHLSPDYEAPPSNYYEVPHTAALKRIKKEL